MIPLTKVMLVAAISLKAIACDSSVDAEKRKRSDIAANVLKALLCNEPLPYGLSEQSTASPQSAEDMAMQFLKSLDIKEV